MKKMIIHRILLIVSIFSKKTRAALARKEGNRHRDRHNWLSAEKCYREYLAVFSEDFAITVQLGHVLKEQRKYDAALDAYDDAIQIRSDDFDVYLCRGHLLKDMGLRHDAIESYKMSARLQPEHNDAIGEIAALSKMSRNDVVHQLAGGDRRALSGFSGLLIKRKIGRMSNESAVASIMGPIALRKKIKSMQAEIDRLQDLSRSAINELHSVVCDLEQKNNASLANSSDFSKRILNILKENSQPSGRSIDDKIVKGLSPRTMNIYMQLKASTERRLYKGE